MGNGQFEDCGTNACNAAPGGEQSLETTQAASANDSLTAADVYDFLNSHYDRLNTDGHAGISSDDLEAAKESGHYQGRDQEIVEFLDATRGYLARLYEDQPMFETVITRDDAQALKDGKIDLTVSGAASVMYDQFLTRKALFLSTGATVANTAAVLVAFPPLAAATATGTLALGLYGAGKGIKNYYDQKDSVKGLFDS